MDNLRKIKDTVASALIIFCSVFFFCAFLLGVFNTQFQIHKLSEMNDNVKIRLKYGCSTQQHTGKNISVFHCLKQFTLKLNYVSFPAFQKMLNNSSRTVINLLIFDFVFIVYHEIVKVERDV